MAQNQNQRGGGNDKLDGYVPVAERIEKFYGRFPEGRILTSITDHDRVDGFVLVRAEVYRNPDDATPAATGHAYEYKDAGYVQKSSYIEVAETSAVGRALAFLNFETKRGIASREEMEKATRVRPEAPPREATRTEVTRPEAVRAEPRRVAQDNDAEATREPVPTIAVVPPKPIAVPDSSADIAATDDQKEEMLMLLEELRPGNRRAQRTLLAELTGKQSRDDLTRAEAMRFIEDLRRAGREALP
jgi:hypothetical protein